VRDLELLSLLVDVVRLGWRVGDDSREPRGECVTDVFADDCWDDFWLSSGTSDASSGASCGRLATLLAAEVAAAPSETAGADLSLSLSMAVAMVTGVVFRGVTADDACQHQTCMAALQGSGFNGGIDGMEWLRGAGSLCMCTPVMHSEEGVMVPNRPSLQSCFWGGGDELCRC
jgi:hypothetical protein